MATRRRYGNTLEGSRSQRSQSRGGNDLPNRAAALQSYAQQSRDNQRNSLRLAKSPTRVVEGVSRTLWLGDRLLLARRVQIGEETVVQGLLARLGRSASAAAGEVADLLPAVEFPPLTAADPISPGPRLATIPVQLAVPMPAVDARALVADPRVAGRRLVVPALAALAAAMTLQRTLTLSERRGAFVSAVTHELRTPLTTFRMYAEMLAEGMVPDAEQRQKYLNTLRVEADRLAHLVENVLQYARLERGRPGKRREPTTLAALLDHCQSRLADRAAQADMKLVVEHDEADGDVTLATDIAAVEQILFNLVDNACKYAASASRQADSPGRQGRAAARADHRPRSRAGHLARRPEEAVPAVLEVGARGGQQRARRRPGPGAQPAAGADLGGNWNSLARRWRRGVRADTAAVARVGESRRYQMP